MTLYKAFLAIAVVGAVLATGGVASAHTERYESRINAAYSEQQGSHGYFYGRVLSERAGCERNRTVTVLRREEGPDEIIGTTRTDVNGAWGLAVKNPREGTYYAVVTRKVQRFDNEHNHDCRRRLSTNVFVAR